MKWIL